MQPVDRIGGGRELDLRRWLRRAPALRDRSAMERGDPSHPSHRARRNGDDDRRGRRFERSFSVVRQAMAASEMSGTVPSPMPGMLKSTSAISIEWFESASRVSGPLAASINSNPSCSRRKAPIRASRASLRHPRSTRIRRCSAFTLILSWVVAVQTRSNHRDRGKAYSFVLGRVAGILRANHPDSL